MSTWWKARSFRTQLLLIVGLGFVLGGRGSRAQVEYDFRTLPSAVRQQAWYVYEHGTIEEKHAMHEFLVLGGYDAAARHFQ